MTRRVVRGVAFSAFTAALLTSTHWPGVSITGPVPRPDLWVHIGAFGLWAFLLAWAWPLARRWRIGLPVAIAFAALDESTQTLFDRHSTLDDFLADSVGVIFGLAAWHALAAGRAQREASDTPTPSPPPTPGTTSR